MSDAVHQLQLQDAETLEYVITHVFCPLRLPSEDDHSIHKDHSLARSIASAANLYREHVAEVNLLQWNSISLFLRNLSAITKSKDLDESQVISQISAMDVGDIIALPIRAQNAGVIFVKQKGTTIYESFELSPRAQDVMTAKGKLICSYPGPAIEIPNSVFDDEDFRSELVNFLAHMNNDSLVSPSIYPQTKGSSILIFKDSVRPHFITALLTGIMRGVGFPTNITRITKRIGDDVMCGQNKTGFLEPWRRSALWLLIRVSLQTTLDSSSLGNHTYKEFMLFFMCCIAKEEACIKLPSDLLQFMSTKIGRRLRKLGSFAPAWLTQTALHTCTSLRDIIESRWRQAQAVQRLVTPWTPSQLNLSQDIGLTLSNIKAHLYTIRRNSHFLASHAPFNTRAKHHRRGVLDDFLSLDGEFFETSYCIEPRVALYDVEHAVEQGIDTWIDSVADGDKACERLERLANIYFSKALEMYANNPELWSVMLLTAVELWIALDKIAVREIPLLADYSPEVPTSVLERLVLCKSANLARLFHAHEYLSLRYSHSTRGSVFTSEITKTSFSVRFYKGALYLQHLKNQIEEKASHEVREKLAELRRKNAEYAKKVLTGRSTSDLSIFIHVWPLPSDQLDAEAFVFELDCPVPFQMWRTATLHLLTNLHAPSTRPDIPHSQLEPVGHFGSELYVRKHSKSRIIFTDNFDTETPKTVRIPATRKQVCVKPAPKLLFFDTRTGIPVSDILGLGSSDVGERCTYKLLESGPYRALQKYVDSTSHTSNEVIADQTSCHKNLSIHEFIAFGHLRCGGSLQWLNILREIRSRSLNFSRLEVHFLLAQAVSQVGPFQNSELTWHQEIREPMFCHALLSELKGLLQDIESNWTQGVAMNTISFLIRRVLASNPDSVVSQKALHLLCTVRNTVFRWVRELFAKISKNPEDRDCRRTLWDAAAICRGTFEVDPILIPTLLSLVENVEILFSSTLIIHSCMLTDAALLSAHSQLLLDRDRRLSLTLEHIVSKNIRAESMNDGINRAVMWIWPEFSPSSRWISMASPNSHWLCNTITGTDGLHPQEVRMNFHHGSLFVNGKPFQPSLPVELVQHPLYKLIFGERILEVTLSSLPGLEFSTKDLICDHRVYFSFRNRGSNLTIRAKRTQINSAGDSNVIELIPPEILEGDLPSTLINGHAHWLDISTSIIEIRPLDRLWETSLDNWKIYCSSGGLYSVRRRDEFLVDIRSPSWAMVSGLFRPLCPPQELIISVVSPNSHQPTSLQLSVLLPRHDLSFYVDGDGDLQSRSIRDMVYDEDQSIGTLFGLVNRLVLRPKNKFKGVDSLEFIPRCVLVPDGDVSFCMDGHWHVNVEITSHSRLKRVTYQTYKVDTELGRLVGNGSLTSKLYCSYLHALTSGSTTDPLTGRSGIEEALSILRSAGCWSSMTLVDRDMELLSLIASLCPMRVWNPEHLAQKVYWHDLPANSQIYELYLISQEIKEHYEKIQAFDGNQLNDVSRKFPEYDGHLLKRSAHRVMCMHLRCEFVHSSRAGFDTTYHPRYKVSDSGERRACIAATLIHNRTATLSRNILEKINLWASAISTASSFPSSLQYDKLWLTLSDIPSMWIKTYNILRETNQSKWFKMLFSLPSMVYGPTGSKCHEMVPVFVAFALHPQFRSENPPPYDSYPIIESRPFLDVLREQVTRSRKHGRGIRNATQHSVAVTAAQRLNDAWPCEFPPPSLLDPGVYDVAGFEFWVQQYFSQCHRRLKLEEHLTRVFGILEDCLRTQTSTIYGVEVPYYSFEPLKRTHPTVQWCVTADALFIRSAPLLCTKKTPKSQQVFTNRSDSISSFSNADDSTPLLQLISVIEPSAENPVQRQFVSALRSGVKSNESSLPYQDHAVNWLPAVEKVVEYYTKGKDKYMDALNQVQQHLRPRNASEHVLEQSGRWPCLAPRALFQCLASNSSVKLSESWKKALTALILLALEMQRARRLLLLRLGNHFEDFWKEVRNDGCDGWDADAHPDWLLIQLQGNFFIRPIQAEVASEMISPRSGNNTVIQLSMGEGKSSVIVPLVAAVLANGDQLVRVVVPKPFMAQTRHLLVDRLGGLTNRRMYYLPFSRSSNIDEQTIETLQQIMLKCMQERGILVVQPEHILSLKLVSVESQLRREKDDPVSRKLLDLQRWFDSSSRDILDESDEILDVRSQLVFAVGQGQQVEGSPERWTTIEQVLGLVNKHILSLYELFPFGVEYRLGPSGSFPYIRILQKDAGEQLISWIVQDIFQGYLPNVSFARLHSISLEDAIRSFISCKSIPLEKAQFLKEHLEKTSIWPNLLLLRGLLATDILLFAFRERRWRVNYGLAPTRTMLAVPYRAKDVPAQKAVFGHPDITILFTCLSYYYAGLDQGQLKHTFMILLDQHDPSLDYDLWVHACTDIPGFLQTASGINLESEEQWNILYPLFSRNRETVNFYLSRVVFPKDIKEFPSKLSASGWHLAEKKKRPVTGFSGTNDGQYLYPLGITQYNLDHQQGTNARVLSYILEPENNYYVFMAHSNDKQRTTHEFLRLLVSQEPEVRVLLDVGAQMLDLENHELAEAWLAITPNASAAIYVNDSDELMVLTRDGSTQLLLYSQYVEQIDRCVVYLDDAHTRGTDIKFPDGFRAAVTLGPRVTKDRLAQGCMRMRRLGHGHSVIFFAPLEVGRCIRAVAGKDSESSIDTMDILHWAIRETWENIQRGAPHWVQQGIEHTSQYSAWTGFAEGQLSIKELSDKWLQPEAKRLEKLYGPGNASNLNGTMINSDMRQRCIGLGMQSLWSVALDEEQEREMVREVTHERQAQRPPKTVEPAKHSVHEEVIKFITTGTLPARLKFSETPSKAFIPAFDTLSGTSATASEAYIWSQSVLTTRDFSKTVKTAETMKGYLRPVQWVVSAKSARGDVFVILSPYEVNCLLPEIRSSNKVHLHVYTPTLIRTMKPCTLATLYSIPTTPNGWTHSSSLMDQLIIFAGQLYLKDYESYIRLCRFLCVYTRDLQGVKVEPDGFIRPENRPHNDSVLMMAHSFAHSPIPSLRALMHLRSGGMEIKSTHMGKILHGKLLSVDDFDE